MRKFLVLFGLIAVAAVGLAQETVTIRLAGYSGDTPLM